MNADITTAQSADTRRCVICGVALERRSTEDTHAFRKRQTCNAPACVTALRRMRSQIQHERAHAAIGFDRGEGRSCYVCGAALVRREGEALNNFRARVTCGGVCGKRHRQNIVLAARAAKRGADWIGRRPEMPKPRLTGAWPAGARFEDDPASIAQSGVRLRGLPPPTGGWTALDHYEGDLDR